MSNPKIKIATPPDLREAEFYSPARPEFVEATDDEVLVTVGAAQITFTKTRVGGIVEWHGRRHAPRHTAVRPRD